ncbi:MAG: acyltransferase [Rhizobiaceae bacterium]|nr:acyltransferase [Rhizobiaceae bacterium]
MPYRADIDGLRAIAILPVVFYHAGISGFGGGFVGVDVFFVISGFLMASLIGGELERNEFSLVRFYERRIRRIFPALFATMIACVVAAWFLLMPVEMEYFARSLKAAAMFGSNFQFEKETGYFDIAAQTKPLLHTWSLAVEEQFYILFPLLLIAIHRFAPRRLTAVLVILFVASLVASAWMVEHSQSAAFYLLPFRAWELLLGSLVALNPLPRKIAALPKETLVALGLALIAVAVFGFNDRMVFPGIAALLPCLGAVLVIQFGIGSQVTAKLLRFPPLVSVGLISYSLYLWHWPLIVFTKMLSGHSLGIVTTILVVLGSIAIATLSWAFIERPFRGSRSHIGRTHVFGGAVVVAVGAVILGNTVVHLKGVPGRLPYNVQKIYAATYDAGRYGIPPCFIDDSGGPSLGDIRAGKLCNVGVQSSQDPAFVVWGDSHSGAMAPAIDLAARNAGVSGLFAGHASCPPLPGVPLSARGDTERCGAFNDTVKDLIISRHIPLVFLVAYWPKYVHDAELPNEGVYFDPSVSPPLADKSAPIRAAFSRLLDDLKKAGTRIVLVHDVPEMGHYIPEAAAKAAMEGASTDLAPPWDYISKRQALSREILAQFAQSYYAEIVDPLPAFCANQHCDALRNGVPLYKDADHITATTSASLSYLFQPVFESLR